MNGTYTQRRRNQMAYGGIAGLDGRMKYGIGSWFQEKIKDPIKEKLVDPVIDLVTDNPAASALLAGAGINQFGIPGTNQMGQNWLGELLGNVVPGGTIDMVAGQGGSGQTLGSGIGNIWNAITGTPTEYSTTRPSGLDAAEKAAQDMAQGTTGAWDIGQWGPQVATQAASKIPGADRIIDMMRREDPTNVAYEDAYRNPLQKVYDTVRNVVTGGPDTQPDASGRYPIRWKEPLAIGSAIGAADYLTRSEDKMPEQLSIDPSRFATAAAAKADPNLRFKPQEQYTLKDGGRIGYNRGRVVNPGGYNGVIDRNIANLQAALKYSDLTDEQRAQVEADLKMSIEKKGGWEDKTLSGDPVSKAHGGRIGYQNAGSVGLEQLLEGLSKEEIEELLRMTSGNAQGGRIGAQEGGLMNLGGMEKDYRQEGGFVPIGGKEKADDVPARLSKNEFVFTADAVRNAGGGDIDEGAKVMENLMENLEAGGEVSEESQGLEGAQAMFANAQQLQKRII